MKQKLKLNTFYANKETIHLFAKRYGGKILYIFFLCRTEKRFNNNHSDYALLV